MKGLKIVFGFSVVIMLLSLVHLEANWWGKAKHWVKKASKKTGHAITHTAKEAGKDIKKAGKAIGKGFKGIGKEFHRDKSYFRDLSITNNLDSQIRVLLRWTGKGLSDLYPYYCNGDAYGIDFLCDHGYIETGKTKSFDFPYENSSVTIPLGVGIGSYAPGETVHLYPKKSVEIIVYKIDEGKHSKLFDIQGYNIDANSHIILGGDASFYPLTVANCGGQNLGSYTIGLRIKTRKDFGKKVWDTIKGMFGFQPQFSPECREGYCYANLSVPFGQHKTLGLPAGMALGVDGAPQWRVTGAYDAPVVGFAQPKSKDDNYACPSGSKSCKKIASDWHSYEKHKIYQVVANKSGVSCACPTHWRPPCSGVYGQRLCCLSQKEAQEMGCPKDDPFCCNKRANDPKVACCCSAQSYEKLEKAKTDKERAALPTCLCQKGEEKDWCCMSDVKGLGCVNDNAVQSPAFKIMTEKIDALYQANC